MSEELQCARCGGIPARKVSIRRHVGMIYLMKFWGIDQPLCRKCGLALDAQWTARTLVQGWWGAISFFFNLFVLGSNGVAALKLRRLKPPTFDHLLTPEEELRRLNRLRLSGEVEDKAFESAKRELLGSL